MIDINLKRKILFVFSDPGGAKPVLAFIENEKLIDTFVISDRIYPFFKDFKTSVTPFNNSVEDILDSYCPDLVFTGTSYSSDIEKQFIYTANLKGIHTISFVDHWTSMRTRFEDKWGNLILPDQIAVIDDRAKRIAISEGLDEKRIMITGNPYYKWLEAWNPSITKEKYLNSIGISDCEKKIVVYAPDPLSNINGKEIYGFDELSATSILVELFQKHQLELKDWKVLVKAHPNQDRHKLSRIIKKDDSFYMLPENVNSNSSIYYADFVMGFFSSFLIEATIMNRPVLRFLNGHLKTDPISELQIGTIVYNKALIKKLLK